MRYNITKIDKADKTEIIFKSNNLEKASAQFLRITKTMMLPTRQAHNSQIAQIFHTIASGVTHFGEMAYLIEKKTF